MTPNEHAPIERFGWKWILNHPLLLAVCGLCWGACLTLSWLYCPDTLGTYRKIAMGCFGGWFCSLCLVAGRLFKP